MFQFGSEGPPEAVWSFLTAPESTRRFLVGLSLESSWAPGSPITGRLGRAPVLQGEVLFARYPYRLSYMLNSGSGQPEVYVTWEVRSCGSGSIVCLAVDEPEAVDSEETEAVWQPVVTTLQALLSDLR